MDQVYYIKGPNGRCSPFFRNKDEAICFLKKEFLSKGKVSKWKHLDVWDVIFYAKCIPYNYERKSTFTLTSDDLL